MLASSNSDVKRKVSRGEVACGLTDSDDAHVAMVAGEPVDAVYLDLEGIGSLIMPNTVSLIANSPNAENGKKLMEFLLEKETESKLAFSCAQIPLRDGVKTPDNLVSINVIRPMAVDYESAAQKLEAIQPYLKNWIENW